MLLRVRALGIRTVGGLATSGRGISQRAPRCDSLVPVKIPSSRSEQGKSAMVSPWSRSLQGCRTARGVAAKSNSRASPWRVRVQRHPSLEPSRRRDPRGEVRWERSTQPRMRPHRWRDVFHGEADCILLGAQTCSRSDLDARRPGGLSDRRRRSQRLPRSPLPAAPTSRTAAPPLPSRRPPEPPAGRSRGCASPAAPGRARRCGQPSPATCRSAARPS